MSRWTSALPRIILTVVLLGIAAMGVDPALRWSLGNGARATTNAKVRLGGVRTRLGSSTAVVDRLAIGDSRDPNHQLIEVDQAVLKFDPIALAKGRLVVRDGELLGVRLNADDAPVRCDRDAARPQLVSEAAALGRSWQQVVAVGPPPLQASPATQMVREIQEQRVAEFSSIMRQAADWQTRFDELDELTRVVGDNPLRMTPQYRRRLEQLAAVGQEIVELNEALDALRRQVQQDRMTLEQAQQDELAELRQNTWLAPVDGERLSSYLLEDEWSRRIGSWVSWIRQARQVASLRPTRDLFAWSNARGVDVRLNAGRESDFEIQNLYLEGAGQLEGQLYRFRGTLQNLSDEPALSVSPMVLTLAAEGPGAIQMDAVLDRSQSVPVDRIRVVCPSLPAPRKVWGDPREFAIEAAPGPLRIALQMEIVDGQRIRGTVDFSQTDTALVPSWPGSQRQGHANQTIQQALSEVAEVRGSVELSGTLEHPIWKLRSDLGDQVASRMQNVLQQELRERSRLLAQQHQRQSRELLDGLVEALSSHEQAAQQRLAEKSAELERFRRRIAQRTDLMDRLVRDAGPLENLLR